MQLRFNDVDALGHVNNSVYFQFFDLVINDPVGKDISQLESWGAIKNYLGKIM